MSLTTVKKEQQNKFFKKADLIIYITLAILIVVLFFVFVVDKDKNVNTGFEIIQDEVVIFSYNFESDTYKVTEGYADKLLIVHNQDVFFVTIYAKENNHYNQISIDRDKKYVYMFDANCSSGKDCTKMSIKDDNDVIVCVPHKLKIQGLSNNIQQPISG